jgi:hypothetical protein
MCRTHLDASGVATAEVTLVHASGTVIFHGTKGASYRTHIAAYAPFVVHEHDVTTVYLINVHGSGRAYSYTRGIAALCTVDRQEEGIQREDAHVDSGLVWVKLLVMLKRAG